MSLEDVRTWKKINIVSAGRNSKRWKSETFRKYFFSVRLPSCLWARQGAGHPFQPAFVPSTNQTDKVKVPGSAHFNEVYERSIRDYHLTDDVNAPGHNPFSEGGIDFLLYWKNWIDTVQWHLEDIIRDPHIDPLEALSVKRRIDRLNQERTDMVERIDAFLMETFHDVTPLPDARLNTESPAWAIDRLSILALKIYHMRIEADRENAGEAHRNVCRHKLSVLLEQREDLSLAIDELLEDIRAGRKLMKGYRQMKMYNDESLNPVLYGKQP